MNPEMIKKYIGDAEFRKRMIVAANAIVFAKYKVVLSAH